MVFFIQPVKSTDYLIMASFCLRASAAAYVVLLIPSAVATQKGPQQGAEINQQRLFGTDCLPGPLQLDSYSTCVATSNDNDLPWAPWSYRPYCADNTNYCVFTNTDFRGRDRGVSVIDVPPSRTENVTSAVASIAKLLSSVPPPAPESVDTTSPPYEMRDIPGKGKGLIATRKIKRGQVFMVDYAAVVADTKLPGRVRQAQGRRLLNEAIERLPGADEVLSLARSSPDPDNVPAGEDVMTTNSFGVEIDGKGYMALFPRIAVSLSNGDGSFQTLVLVQSY